MRLFLAALPGSEMKKALTEIQDELRRRGIKGNYTKEDNLHLTLAFIGEWPDPDTVMEALETLRFEPLELKLTRLGSFGETIWAGTEENEKLSVLVSRLRHALSDASIPFDRKRFRAHFTLLRQPVYGRDPELGLVSVPRACMRIDRLSLMLSERSNKGMIYTELDALTAEK